MMKGIFNIVLGLVVACSILVSCSEEEGVGAFNIDKTEITIGEAGGEEYVVVKSSTEWVAESSHPWIMISPANGVGVTECRIVVDSSLVNDMRTASVRFSPQGQAPKLLEVRQTGFDKMITFDKDQIDLKSSVRLDKRFFEVDVTTNVKFKLELKDSEGKVIDWLETKDTEVDLDRGARPRSLKMRFDWKVNTKPVERVAKINFVPVNAEEVLAKPAVLTVNQDAAPKIEDTRAGDSLALLILQERLGVQYGKWDGSENLRNWRNVELWEVGDEYMDYTVNPEGELKTIPEAMIGRVRAARFYMININEEIPEEIKHLKYVETLEILSNPNVFLKSLHVGPWICQLEHLAALRIYSYGIVDLPEEFTQLGKTLEALDLGANNLTDVPAILTPENFPHLVYLYLGGNKRWTCNDLRNADNYDNGLGGLFQRLTTTDSSSIRDLFRWEKLEYLCLSNNFLEGELPDFVVGEENVVGYSEEDVIAFGGDTIANLVKLTVDGKKIPKILPNMRHLSVNLNFLTGKVPNWMLYHPHFIEWDPYTLVFNQENRGIDSKGKLAGFENEVLDYEYYFKFYPRYRDKYEFHDMKDEEEETK